MRKTIGRVALAGTCTVLALAGILAATTGTTEAKADPRTWNLKKKVDGKKAADWTAEWWQWAYSLPVSVHPLFSDTGAYVEVGQRGPVWFLGGSFLGAETAPTRVVTIPAGKSLLVPLVNVNWDQLDPTTPTVELMRQAAATYIAATETESLVCTVDGVPIANLDRNRVVSPAFEYTTPDDGVYFGTGQGFPGGIYRPAVSDGYWVFLRPLAIGEHTLHCEARTRAPYPGFQSFTYEITVVDHDQP